MKKFLVFVLIVGALLAFTNPDMDDFGEFVRTEVADQIEREVGEGALADVLGGAGGALLGDNIARFTERQSYVVCSTYAVDFDRDGEPNGRMLGIAGQFIVLDEFDVEN